MKPTSHRRANCIRLGLPLLLAAPLWVNALPAFTFAAYPLFLAPSVKPNWNAEIRSNAEPCSSSPP